MKNKTSPVVPVLVPKRGSALSHLFWQKTLHAQDWEVVGEIPNISKALVIAAPHTSNVDAWYAFMAIMSLGLNVTVMAKDSLFKPPFKSILKWLNVIPVKRSSPQGLIDQIVSEFERHDSIWVAMSPEGTRSGAEKWKSGFYRIAMAAHVPIMIVAIDYRLKQVVLKGLLQPSGHYEEDLELILQQYQGIEPYNVEQLSLPLKQKRQPFSK